MTSNLLDHDFGSEEEDDDFNPGVQEDSDAEDVKPAKPSAHTNNAADEDDGESQNGDENEEGGGEDLVGDYDDDEEDEEEEVQQMSRPTKRQRGGVYNFIEDEAGVDEEEDEAEDDEDELAEFGAEMHPDDLDALPAGAETDDRRHRQLDRQRELDATMDAEKQAQMLKERYGRNRAAATDSLVVPKRLLLPSVEDPSIWGGRCKPGKEREVVYAIQKRIEERPPGSRNPIRIISAFERGKVMLGWFYCEARRQPDVTDGLEGINFYYPSQKLTLVPVKEMPDLLRVRKSEELMPGGWVRIKRGKYRGDLAQIEEVETNGLNVTVRLVPRLDYGMTDDNAALPDSKRKRGGSSHVPPQRLFSESEAKKRHGKFLSSTAGLGGKSWNYLGDSYVEGFLVKDMRVQHLETENVKPRLDEVTKFARGGEDGTSTLDLASLADTMKNARAQDSYQPGDPVEVYRGEQQGLIGKTVSTRGDIVSIQVTEGDLTGQTIDAPFRTLRKRFREGDHVKVIGNGSSQGELGMVVQVQDDKVTILGDMSLKEIEVFSKDLRLSAETSNDGNKPGFQLHSLVMIDSFVVGCILRIEHGKIRLLDQNGSIRDMPATSIAGLEYDSRGVVTLDRNGAEIQEGETVREAYGEQRTGTIIHIHSSFVFLRNKTLAENSGIFVARNTNLVGVSGRGGRSTGPDLSKMNPAIAMQKPGAGRGAQMPPPNRGRDRLEGKTVTVRKGRFKGLVGFVRDADDTYARVELYTVNKPVLIEREILVPKDPITMRTLEGGRGRGGRGGRTPYGGAPPARDAGWSGGRTPISANDSSRTPAWGSSSSARTPAWSGGGMAGSRTPAWKNDGNRTAYGDGSRTAYGGGNRTPAWNSGSRTPYDSGSGSGSGYDAFASGSRTPAWGANTGNRTPAWGGLSNNQAQRDYDDAPTPGGYSAPTPGAYGAPTPGASAPTPGAWADNAPTPGGAFSAPTPGAGPKRGYDAPTPAPYDAPTPALGGAAATPGAGYDDDGGPRYDEGTPSP